MLRALVISCLSVVLSAGCNSGHVDFNGYRLPYEYTDSDYPYSLSASPVHPLPELQSPIYDVFKLKDSFNFPLYNGGQSTGSLLDLWFIPRVVGAPVIRRFSTHSSYDSPEETETVGVCSLRMEYKINSERACGDRRRCIQLALVVTHNLPVDSTCGNQPAVGDPAQELVEIVEDLQAQTLRYAPDLSPDLENEVELGTAIAWRRSVAPQWAPITTTGSLPGMRDANAYPDGERVLVFGIAVAGGFKGARYNAVTNKWSPLPTENAPVFDRFGAWTMVGDRLLVVTAGKAHWLKGDAWEAAPDVGLPDYSVGGSPGCVRMAATGKAVMIWGSKLINDEPTSFGAVLGKDEASWRLASAVGAPNSRCYPTINALAGEFVVVGADGVQSLYFPQGNGLWAAIPVLSDENPRLLDTFLWAGQHTAVFRDDSDDWATRTFDAKNLNWVVQKTVYRYGMGATSVGDMPVLVGGLHENWNDTTTDMKVLVGDGMMIFSTEEERQPLVLPPTEWLVPRAKPLVVYLPSGHLFVWGGCSQYAGSTCATYSDTGAVLKAVLGK